MACVEGLQIFWRDLTRKELLPIKAMFALISGAIYALNPFLTVHFKSLGGTSAETGIIYSVLPIVTFIVPPLIGIVADKIGHIKVIFGVVCVTAGIISNLLLIVPYIKHTYDYPDTLSWTHNCSSSHGDNSIYIGELNHPCILHSQEFNATFNVTECYMDCHSQTGPPFKEICPSNHPDNCVPISELSSELSNSTYEWPPLHFTQIRQPGDFHNLSEPISFPNVFQFTSVSVNHSTEFKFQCPSSNRSMSCVRICHGRLKGSDICKPTVVRNQNAFYAYLGVRVALAAIAACIHVLFEAITVTFVKFHKTDYGLQRLWGAAASCVFAPVTGILIDIASRGKARTDFGPAFYIFMINTVITAILLPFLSMEIRMPSHKLGSEIFGLFKNAHFDVFMLVAFIKGVLWGFVENFLFWLLEEIHATRTLMGLTVTMGNLCGIPLLIYSGIIIKKIGHVNVIALALICYFIRFVGYSLIQNPYLCLPFDALDSITTILFVVAGVTYTAILAPPSALASAQGILMGLYYGFGKGAGSSAGGFLLNILGTRLSFRYMGIASGIAGVTYALVHHFILNRFQLAGHEEREKAALAKAEMNDNGPKPDVLIGGKRAKDHKDLEKSIVTRRHSAKLDNVIMGNDGTYNPREDGAHNKAFTADDTSPPAFSQQAITKF